MVQGRRGWLWGRKGWFGAGGAQESEHAFLAGSGHAPHHTCRAKGKGADSATAPEGLNGVMWVGGGGGLHGVGDAAPSTGTGAGVGVARAPQHGD